jgi:hypothetical protein
MMRDEKKVEQTIKGDAKSRNAELTLSVSKAAGLAVSVRKNNPTKSNNPTIKSRIIDSPHFLFFVSANDPSEAIYTMAQ